MKFLLAAVNAKYIHSNPALYMLRDYAGDEVKKNIEIAEYTINQDINEILEDILSRNPDFVGFSCYIWNYRIVKAIIKRLNKVSKNIDIWLGGPEVSFAPYDEYFDELHVKGIMAGEGEEAFSQLVRCYLNGNMSDIDSINGIVTSEKRHFSMNETDVSKLPFIYQNDRTFDNRIIYYESQRGCPFQCTYCLSSLEKTLRLKAIETVKKELGFFIEKCVPQVKFLDRTFNASHEHAMAIWRFIKENDNGITNFHFEIEADILKEEAIEFLGTLRKGLVQFEIGVQSFNQDTLHAVKRFTDMEKLVKIVGRLREFGNINLHLDLIAGLPYEDYESFGKSFDRVYSMRPDQLQLGFLKVLKGSPIASQVEEHGIVFEDDPPYEILYTKYISYKDVRKLKHIEEMVEMYYNSMQFSHTLSFLSRCFESPFKMYECLAEFFKENGYFTNSPKRIYRYDILLQFAIKYDKNHEEIYKELLTYDVYLRENIKQRPEFAKELKEYSEKIKEIYKKEAVERKYLREYSEFDSKQLQKMTHVEVFDYPVMDKAELNKLITEEITVDEIKNKEPEMVIFNYRNINPVNQECLHFKI